MIDCPACKKSYEVKPNNCAKCSFPFEGSDKEKSVFLGKLIMQKSVIADEKRRIKIARVILWIIGVMNIAATVIMSGKVTYVGILFIVAGFLTYKLPLIATLIPFIVLIVTEIALALINPSNLLNGLLLKMVYYVGLSYALAGIIKAQRIKNKSDFFKEFEKENEGYVSVSEMERSSRMYTARAGRQKRTF